MGNLDTAPSFAERMKTVLAVIVVLGIVIGMVALSGNAPPTQRVAVRPQPDPSVNPAAASAYVNDLARRFGNHYERLTDNDRTLLNALSRGHGRELLKIRVELLQDVEATSKRTHSSGSERP